MDKNSWETPIELFNVLHDKFNFQYDMCASRDNAKLQYYFTEEGPYDEIYLEGVQFCNPPYGRGLILPIVSSHLKRRLSIVYLVPNRSSAEWFKLLLKNCDSMLFLKKRVQFTYQGKKSGTPNFDCVLFGLGVSLKGLTELGSSVSLRNINYGD